MTVTKKRGGGVEPNLRKKVEPNLGKKTLHRLGFRGQGLGFRVQQSILQCLGRATFVRQANTKRRDAEHNGRR